MEKPRFPPQTYSNTHMQLQKEIYSKEAKALGLSTSPEKFIPTKSPEIRSRFQSVLDNPTYTSQDIPQTERSRINARNFNSSVPLSYSINNKNMNFSDSSKNLENIYKARIGAALKYKEQYDFNNRSPITWLGKKEAVTENYYSRSNKPFADNGLQLSSTLNAKRILKGMGYNKTNIFNN